MNARIEKNKAHTVYIGSLIKSYIQSHLTPMWIPLNQQTTHLQNLVVLEPFNKPYQEVLIPSPLHKKE